RILTLAPRHAGDTYSRVRLMRVQGAAAAKSGDVRGALRAYSGALRETRRAQSALFVDEWRVGFLEGEPPLLDESLGVLMERRPRPRPREVLAWIARARRVGAAPAEGPAESSPAVRRQVLSLRAELEACIARLWRLQNAGTRRVQSITARRLEQRTAIIEGRLRSLAAAMIRVPRFAGVGRDLARPLGGG